jgi:hypothetical protein
MDNNYESSEYVEYVKKQPVWAFCLLAFMTFGLYNLYWFYRNWRFLKELYRWGIYPFWRAVFTIFFVHTLFEHINDLAVEKGHRGIASNLYATGFIIASILQRMIDQLLPAPAAFLAVLIPSFLFLVPTVKQLNFLYNLAYPNEYKPAFSPGELIALLMGGILMASVVLSLLTGN